ncbi:TRAP transporter substrate-binding protein [bacterium]|nr:TRAP transporter substrate-binding protein [bacterium]
MKKSIFLLVFALVLCLSTQAMAEVVFSFGHSNPPNDRSQNHYFFLKFAELAKKYSNGEIVINEFPSNQLGGEQARVNKARKQTNLITQASTPNVAPFAPSAGVLSLPYLFDDMDEILSLLNGEFGNTILAERIRKESGLRVLGYLTTGFRMITNSKRCVNEIGEMEGLKIRVPKDAIMLKTFEAWGVNPITMAWPEVFTGLQQGVIDGQINSYITNYAASFHEVQKYITPLSAMPWIAPILISDKGFSRLEPKIQQALLKAAKEASLLEQAWGIEREKEFQMILVEKGMVMCPLKDKNTWKEKARAIWPDLYDKVGGKEIVDQALSYIK